MGGEFTRAELWIRMRLSTKLIKIGALLEEVPAEGAPLKIEGSCMVALASSKDEVLEMLKKDIYAKSGVWDFSKVSLAFKNVRKGSAKEATDSNLSVQVCVSQCDMTEVIALEVLWRETSCLT